MTNLYGGKTLEQLEALANAATQRQRLYGHNVRVDDLKDVDVFLDAIPALIARIRELEKECYKLARDSRR